MAKCAICEKSVSHGNKISITGKKEKNKLIFSKGERKDN